MPWQQSVFPLLIVTPSGGFTGLFFYSPAPGAGNLIASVTAASGIDPFGNSFQQGFTSYQIGSIPGNFLQLLGSTLVLNSNLPASKITHGAVISLIDATAASAGPAVNIFSPNTAVTTQAGRALLALIGTSQDLSVLAQLVSDPIYAWDPSAAAHTQAETWHTITTVAGMTINAGGHIAYRKTNDNQVEMEVQNVTASSTADGTTVVTAANGLPAAYRPLAEKRRPLAYAVAKSTVGAYPAATFAIQTDGSIQCYGFAAADRIDGQFRFPLDN